MALRDEFVVRDFQGHAVERVVDLTVSEMVELAKAGVKVELAGRVAITPVPPPPKPLHHVNGEPNLNEMIRQRWRMSRMASHHYELEPPQLCAIRHEEKIYVFAYGGKAEPEIIVDEAAIYPSDALLARIHLMMQHAK